MTTIKVTRTTSTSLNKLKIHPRQAYDEVISELLKNPPSKSYLSRFTSQDNFSITTIKISKSNVSSINKLKIHPRQSNDEVVSALIKFKLKNDK